MRVADCYWTGQAQDLIKRLHVPKADIITHEREWVFAVLLLYQGRPLLRRQLSVKRTMHALDTMMILKLHFVSTTMCSAFISSTPSIKALTSQRYSEKRLPAPQYAARHLD